MKLKKQNTPRQENVLSEKLADFIDLTDKNLEEIETAETGKIQGRCGGWGWGGCWGGGGWGGSCCGGGWGGNCGGWW